MAKLIILFSVLMLVAMAAAGDESTTISADGTTTLAPGNDTAPAAPGAPADALAPADARGPADALAPDTDAAPAAPADAALAPGADADTDSANQTPQTNNQGSR